MLQVLRERRQDDRGFTLIELMIVVLIIGILIAVGLPTFLGARERAQDRAAQALLRNGIVAAKTFYTDANTYSGFTTTTAATIEQSITWASVAPSVPGPVYVTADTTSVTLLTKSGSGAFFCLKDIAGAASGNGTFYGRSTAADSCPSTASTAVTGWAPPTVAG